MEYSKYKLKCEYFASEQQMEADNLAIQLLDIKNVFGLISVVQSICDFNLAWLYNISPSVIVHVISLELLCNNVKKFNRKITISEFMKYDSIINCYKITDFNDFKSRL